MIDQNKSDLTGSVDHAGLIETGITFDKTKIIAFLNNQRSFVAEMLSTAEQKAKDQLQKLINDANTSMLDALTGEIKRLVRLQKVNPTIRTEEIEHLKDIAIWSHDNIQSAELRLDAVRFIITS